MTFSSTQPFGDNLSYRVITRLTGFVCICIPFLLPGLLSLQIVQCPVMPNEESIDAM